MNLSKENFPTNGYRINMQTKNGLVSTEVVLPTQNKTKLLISLRVLWNLVSQNVSRGFYKTFYITCSGWGQINCRTEILEVISIAY